MSLPFKSIVLRTNTLPSGRKYDTVELFGFDMWLRADLVGDRQYKMAQMMAESLGLELKDERIKEANNAKI